MGTIIATVLLMPGAEPGASPDILLTSLPRGPLSLLPISDAAQEFLILGGAPSLLCHLISCLLLICYYRCSHTWRSLGTERDLKSCCWCPCPSVGRLCFRGNPVVGEIPFWEQVREREIKVSLHCFRRRRETPASVRARSQEQDRKQCDKKGQHRAISSANYFLLHQVEANCKGPLSVLPNLAVRIIFDD